MGDGAGHPRLRQRQHRRAARRRARHRSAWAASVGSIEDFRDGVSQDDDEVAVLHGPAELGYPSVTEPMVNIRATLAAAVRDRILEPETSAELCGIAKELFYKQRSWEAVLRLAGAQSLPEPQRRGFAAWLPTGRIDQKRRDAEAMLAVMRAHLAARPGPLLVTYHTRRYGRLAGGAAGDRPSA